MKFFTILVLSLFCGPALAKPRCSLSDTEAVIRNFRELKAGTLVVSNQAQTLVYVLKVEAIPGHAKADSAIYKSDRWLVELAVFEKSKFLGSDADNGLLAASTAQVVSLSQPFFLAARNGDKDVETGASLSLVCN